MCNSLFGHVLACEGGRFFSFFDFLFGFFLFFFFLCKKEKEDFDVIFQKEGFCCHFLIGDFGPELTRNDLDCGALTWSTMRTIAPGRRLA